LLIAECRLFEIPLRAASVPLQITVPDGGEDGRIEWQGGTEMTQYLPSRFCIFQSKAQNLTESFVKTEVLKKQSRYKKRQNGKKNRKGKKELNDAMAEVLSRGGAYVIFCSRAFVKKKIQKLREAIEASIREAGNDPSKAV
jgi:hypothetical protein